MYGQPVPSDLDEKITVAQGGYNFTSIAALR
jgi:hypothetical protein